MRGLRGRPGEGQGSGAGAGGVEPLRLIFDENLSPKVAKALQLLDKDVQYIGRGGTLAKGTPDREIAEVLADDGAYMFTKNFDMVMAWADQGGRFIWLDPRYEPTRYQQARLMFLKWDQWERTLSEQAAECLRVGMSVIEPLSLTEGRARAARRFEQQEEARQRAAERRVETVRPAVAAQLDFSGEDN